MDGLQEYLPVIRRIVLIVITIYIIISGLLYLFQSDMIFYRQNLTAGRIEYISRNYPEANEINIITPDGTELHGWLVRRTSKKPSPLLIYFGGNAEEVSWMIDETGQFADWSVLLVNYRGYGRSKGKPGEQALMKDALYLYDTFTGREDIDETKVAAMGRSLGTAMAVRLSANRNIRRTVLVSPYGSIEDLARSNFPFVPVGLLLKHKFDVKEAASSASNPMLTIVASGDRIVPVKHSEKLFEDWAGEKNFKIINNADHNTISFNPEFWIQISDFLKIRN